jgi:predicted RecA/RadA family phage recombinase
MKNQVDSGVVLEYTNATGLTISAGAVVVMGKMAGIAINDIANLATGLVSIHGRYTVTKKTSTDKVAQGDILIDNSGVVVMSAGTDITTVAVLGRAAEASTSAVTTVDVKLGL